MRPFPFFRHVFWFGLGVGAFITAYMSLSLLSGQPFVSRGYVDDGSLVLMMCLGWTVMGLLFGTMYSGWLQWRSHRERGLPWFVSLIAGALYCPVVFGGIFVAYWMSGTVVDWIGEQNQNKVIGTAAGVLMFGTPFLLAELQVNVGRLLFGQTMTAMPTAKQLA